MSNFDNAEGVEYFLFVVPRVWQFDIVVCKKHATIGFFP